MEKILVNNLKKGFQLYADEYEEAALRVLRSGWYVLGEEVSSFENKFARLSGVAHCIGVDNGLNAISLGLKALGIGSGDEIIVQANTYIATVIGVTQCGATPIFVEPDDFYNIDTEKIEEKITKNTKGILVTHLYGQAAQMDKIVEICNKYGLYLTEDCAQAHFAQFNGKNVGTFGELGFFSFYPTKNLGAFGDGGAILTNNPVWDKALRTLRNYGSNVKYHNEVVGDNARLDEMQAALLKVKMDHFFELQASRKRIVERYLSEINNAKVTLPKVREKATHTWHLFVVRVEDRDGFRNHLSDQGIMTDVHYPIPPHLSQAYEYLGFSRGDFPITEKYADTVVSLPIYDGMLMTEVDRVIEVINNY